MHVIFRDKNIPPDEVYAKPKRIRNFMYASILLAQEEHEEWTEEQENKKTKGG